MTKTMTAALMALALAGGSLAVVPAARADSLTVTTGPVFGYSDGYWDQGHAWHNWANHDAMVSYGAAHHDHYYNYKHDRDADMGWRAHDTYWQK